MKNLFSERKPQSAAFWFFTQRFRPLLFCLSDCSQLRFSRVFYLYFSSIQPHAASYITRPTAFIDSSNNFLTFHSAFHFNCATNYRRQIVCIQKCVKIISLSWLKIKYNKMYQPSVHSPLIVVINLGHCSSKNKIAWKKTVAGHKGTTKSELTKKASSQIDAVKLNEPVKWRNHGIDWERVIDFHCERVAVDDVEKKTFFSKFTPKSLVGDKGWWWNNGCRHHWYRWYVLWQA